MGWKVRHSLVSWALLCSAPAAWAGVQASSELVTDEGEKHPASLAVDGRLLTGWAEGEMGAGDGSWIELTFDKPTKVSSVSIWAGDLRKGERSLKEHGRPRLVSVHLDDGPDGPISVPARIGDAEKRGIHRVDVSIEGTTRKVRVVIDEAVPGFLRNDTFIAEIAVNLRGGETPAFDRLTSYVESSRGEREAEAHKEAVVALFDKVDTAEFGDRDALGEIMLMASDGAPWMQKQVARNVPVGFRMNALPIDQVSVSALLKLKDANAIPALAMASTRLTGKAQRKLEKQISYFRAFAELKGGPRRSLDTWGTPGWEKGALQGFGEPLGIVQGAYGDLYVADTANHRVSVFRPDGTTRDVWGGGEPVVTDVWLAGTRTHYVAGATPSSDAGGFSMPVDIDIQIDRNEERVVVLDASGRVQWLSGDGKVLGGWKIEAEGDISADVGGEGHVVLVRNKVVVIWGNEALIFEEDGTESMRWAIEDGVPVAATALKNGKLALGFQGEVVTYDLDGYRQGVLFDGDAFPGGAEFWDMQLDEKGKLWLVTDNGLAVKYKRPGKVDYQVQWTDLAVSAPRFTVREDMLHITNLGKILKVDALEAKAQAELGDEEDLGLDE